MMKTKIKNYIPASLRKFIRNYLLSRPIYNLYKTDFKRNVLISYIAYPFRCKSDRIYRHTNFIESIEISKIWKNLDFNVDIFNYDYSGKINYSKYDVIFGFGDPLCKYFYNQNPNKRVITIYYGTGMHVCHQNNFTLKRVKEVYKKTGFFLPESGRIVEKTWSEQTTLVDAMILLGNEIVAQTYRMYYEGPIYLLNPSFIQVISDIEISKIIENKNFSEAKKHFLWFGGTGLIHKGLDLVLETFSKYSDLHLHICGPIDDEPDFKRVFYDKLYKKPNIHTYGFINIKSELFKDLIKKCAFVIFPSCSEGGGASVLNCMAEGLIPVVTKYVSINVGDFGIIINEPTQEDVEKSVNEAKNIENSKLKEMALSAMKYTRENHSIEVYTKTLFKYLIEILKGI